MKILKRKQIIVALDFNSIKEANSIVNLLDPEIYRLKIGKQLFAGEGPKTLEYFNKQKPLNREESVSEFIIRRFGKEILEYAINPFVAGTYAGDPDELSIMHAFPKLYHFENKYGSIFRGLLKEKKDSYSIKRRTISKTYFFKERRWRIAIKYTT